MQKVIITAHFLQATEQNGMRLLQYDKEYKNKDTATHNGGSSINN